MTGNPFLMTLTFLVSLCFEANAFYFYVNGEQSAGSLNLAPHRYPPYAAGHFDWMSFTNVPGEGVRVFSTAGNAISGFTRSITVMPDAGDPSSGHVSVLLTYSALINAMQTFENFQAEPFGDIRVQFCVSLSWNEGDVFLGDSYLLSPDSTEIPLSFPIGIPVYFSYMAGVNHEPIYQWTPVVIDPNLPGYAQRDLSAWLSPETLAIVPEPGALSLLLLSGILGFRFGLFGRRSGRGVGQA